VKFEMTKKTKFFLLASLIFFGTSVAFSVIGGLLLVRLSLLYFGPLSGLGGMIHGLGGVIGTILGLIFGTLIALVLNLKLGKKWEDEFGQSEGERGAERIRLTCLSFLAFLVLLWGLIVVIARL